MSKYEEENGTIHFTKSGYQKVMSKARKVYNAYVDDIYSFAVEIHLALSKIKGGNATKKRTEVFSQCVGDYSNRITIPQKQKSVAICDDLHHILRSEMFRGKNGTLTKPRRSAFPKLTNKVRNFSFHDGDLSIIFTEDEDSCTIMWEVGRNNHAIESANNSPLAKVLFDSLADYKWKRSEGGAFYSTNEYEEDSCSRFSRPSRTFGPLGKKETEAVNRAVAAYYSRR